MRRLLIALLIAAIALALALLSLCAKALAQSSEGHARYHQYYLHWKQPGTTISCCNARITQFGVESGDCEPTRAEIRDGNWYAWERLTQKWLLIPDDRIIRERNPAGEEAHLCFNKYTGQILCFVPPDTGG